jgi:hypothetical protein
MVFGTEMMRPGRRLRRQPALDDVRGFRQRKAVTIEVPGDGALTWWVLEEDCVLTVYLVDRKS